MKWRALALALLAGLLVLQALPIAMFHACGGIWALNNAEDFDYLFWPPLKTAYAPSYFFLQMGFVSWDLMRWMHAAVKLGLGSHFLSIAYLQAFGYGARILYALLTLAVPLFWWRRRRDARLCALILALALSLPLAAPNILGLYHFRVGAQLTYQLVALLAGATSLAALEGYLAGEGITGRQALLWGLLAGLTFAEVPHYLLFLLPLFALAVGRNSGWRVLLRTLLGWGVGAAAGYLGAVVLFYRGDGRSIGAALASTIEGMRAGFPQPQPGFQRDFIERRFDPGSDYFPVHLVLALQVAVLAAFGAATAACWRRLGARARYAGAALLIAFGFVWFAHTRIWLTRGSYTTVFSLVYFGFIATALALRLLLRYRETAEKAPRATAAAAAGFAVLGFILPWAQTLERANFGARAAQLRADGIDFQSFNRAVDLLPKPLGIVFSQDRSAFLLGEHYVLGGYFSHTGAGFHGEDGRFSARVRQDWFPDVRFLHSWRIAAVSFDFRRWAWKTRTDVGWPGDPPPALLFALPTGQVRAEAEAIQRQAGLADRSQAPFPSPAEAFPSGGAGYRRKEGRGAGWSVTPLDRLPSGKAFVDAYWPADLARSGRTFYLVSPPGGFYLLGLQRSALIK